MIRLSRCKPGNPPFSLVAALNTRYNIERHLNMVTLYKDLVLFINSTELPIVSPYLYAPYFLKMLAG
jgi:hypothetical protein